MKESSLTRMLSTFVSRLFILVSSALRRASCVLFVCWGISNPLFLDIIPSFMASAMFSVCGFSRAICRA